MFVSDKQLLQKLIY